MTSSSAGNPLPSCPVCKTIPVEDHLGAQGFVLTAIDAAISGSEADVRAAYETASPLDFHVAVSMLVNTLYNLCALLGADFDYSIQLMRRQLNAALSSTGGS